MFRKAINFLREVRQEMAKVSWPTKRELKSSTIVVIILSLLLTVFIFVADQILSRILRFIY